LDCSHFCHFSSSFSKSADHPNVSISSFHFRKRFGVGNETVEGPLICLERMDMPIIFITGKVDVPTSVQAMKAGAFEFLLKPLRDEVLVPAMRQALDRSRIVLDQQAEMRALRGSYASLTPREREVMVLVASGLLNKQVGWELGISEITVKAHRGKMMQKMKADSLAALVRMAAKLHISPIWNESPGAHAQAVALCG
jgi:DNA-binding CsgD family transcriptional regulator